MMHHKMNRALSSVGVGILCAVAACAGGDTPARNSALVEFLSDEYGSGTPVGAVGGMSGSGNTGGSGNNSSGSGGNSSSGSGGSASGDGGSASGDGGDGGSDVGGGGSAGGGDCDGFGVLLENCGGPTCHGAGTPYTEFAISESAAVDWADEPAAGGCASNGTPIFDTEDPSQSLVILKLGSSPPCGTPMPFGTQGNVISDDDIACIEEFIGGL
jgi:hypothetical protein